MRKKSWLLPLAVILVSCVGAPQGPQRSAGDSPELFDMAGLMSSEKASGGTAGAADAGLEQPAVKGAATVLQAALPEPELPSADAGEGGKEAPSAELSAVAPRMGSYSTRMKIALPVVRAPAMPAASTRPVQSPNGTEAVPPAGTAASRAASPNAVSTSPTPASAASGNPQKPAQTAAALGTARPSSSSQGVQTASTPALAAIAPPKTSTSRTAGSSRAREIYARIGDELEIGLEGGGYVFLGFTDTNKSEGMLFKSKESRNGKTYFKFKAASKGDYDLGFLRQDNASGKSDKESVLVHVVSDEEFVKAVSLQAADPAPDESDGDADYVYAQKLIDMGKYPAALQELMKGYTDGNSLANDLIASVYFRMREYDAAEKYYKKNLLIAGIPAERAVIGLVSMAIQRRDSDGFFNYFKQLLAIRDLVIEDVLLRAARFQLEAGEITVGLELADECVRRYPQGARRDEADVLTAQLLEAESPRRDIQRARDLYRKVLDAFPESAFAGLARDRIRYIEQHFYFVR